MLGPQSKRRGFAFMVVVLVAGCGGGSTTGAATPTPSPQLAGTITQTKSDCTFSAGAAHVKAGLVSFTMANQTGADAAFDVWWIPEDHTYAQVVAYMQEERRLAEAGQDGLGHPPYFVGTEPPIRGGPSGATSITASGNLTAGTYGIVCIQLYQQVGELRPLAAVGPVIVE